MARQSVTIVDRGRDVVATADVEFLKDHYSGQVNIDRMSPPLRLLFEEYEEIVNDQVFSLLDQIEGQISAIPFVAVFDDGCEASVKDLQIFPRGGSVAFRVAEPVEVNRSRISRPMSSRSPGIPE
jgi:hypothetical protein